MAPDQPTAAAVPSTEVKKSKKGKLIRPRGKRGGAKNRKKTSSSTAPPTKAKANAKKPDAKANAKKPEGKDQPSHAQKIAEYHTLQKRLAQAKAQSGTGNVKANLAVKEIEAQLADLAAYQAESLRGRDMHNAGETSKWLVKAFGPEWKAYQAQHGKRRARLLDVGALSGTAYNKYGWIDATSIDLNPQGELVSKADFFKLAPPEGSDEDPKFDVVSLSLVINFVGDLFARGEMLLRPHKFLTPRGYVFVALPLACISNSRYLNHDLFRDIVSSAGYDVVAQDDSAKLTRWLLRRKEDESKACWNGKAFKKREVRVGASYNNFCIRLGAVGTKTDDANEKSAKSDSKAGGQGDGPDSEMDDQDDEENGDDSSEDEDGDEEEDEDMDEDEDEDSDDSVSSD